MLFVAQKKQQKQKKCVVLKPILTLSGNWKVKHADTSMCLWLKLTLPFPFLQFGVKSINASLSPVYLRVLERMVEMCAIGFSYVPKFKGQLFWWVLFS